MAVNRGFIQRVAATLASRTKEVSRALPDSKGMETPKQLQTYRTEAYSLFTVPSKEPELFYSAENWVTLKLTLETAGPVAVGPSNTIAPVLSGKGRLLDTGKEYEVKLAKGTRFYIVSESINRVAVTIEPIPWLEQIDADNVRGQAGVMQTVQNVGQSIVNAITGLSSLVSSRGNSAADLPPCPPNRQMIPRLTAVTPSAGGVRTSATPPRNVGGRGSGPGSGGRELPSSPGGRRMR